ncbi:MAG: NDP-sugar pyrophosphorylase family protein [Janthinobacterium sp.]
MQIIIPMSGYGERFRRAGYATPKPLIEIDGKPIIAHVLALFPGEHDVIFICNRDHLADPAYRMAATLRQYCPTGRIVGIAPHKLGPVHAVLQIAPLIDPNLPLLVNYCDFSCVWDWQYFKQFVAASGCAGAIPAYRGFHPHTLGSTNYAYLKVTDGWVTDIAEKQPFTDDRMSEFASSGSYYFASARLMLDALRHCVAQDWQVGGEYYVSLAYKALLAAGLPVAVYPLQHFMQWGTPEDVAEYRGWSAAFERLAARKAAFAAPVGAVVIPLAGLGQRFASAAYSLAKPLIPVSGLPMVAQAAAHLPPAQQQVFIIRADMPGAAAIDAELRRLYPTALVAAVPGVTDGQASTALAGLSALEQRLEHGADSAQGPVTFGACDNGALYDAGALQALFDNPDVDVIVWGVRGHANAVRHPAMFGWIAAEDGLISAISVKAPLASPATDPVVLGTFTFRRGADFRRAVAQLVARDGRVNGEFYIDACINDAIALGLRCHLFEVDSFLCWGTPDDLRTFEYWQSCFHLWQDHSYRLERDSRIPLAELPALEQRCSAMAPPSPPSPQPPISSASSLRQDGEAA